MRKSNVLGPAGFKMCLSKFCTPQKNYMENLLMVLESQKLFLRA